MRHCGRAGGPAGCSNGPATKRRLAAQTAACVLVDHTFIIKRRLHAGVQLCARATLGSGLEAGSSTSEKATALVSGLRVTITT